MGPKTRRRRRYAAIEGYLSIFAARRYTGTGQTGGGRSPFLGRPDLPYSRQWLRARCAGEMLRVEDNAMSELDLGKYWDLFPEALNVRYGEKFKAGFERIDHQYKAVRSGDRRLTIEDVMAIFDKDLPFVQDWTKPDREDLAARMESMSVAKPIADLRNRNYDLELLREIRYCFRELSLTALVLQHVYPDRFAMCSHHLASQLYITAPTVPKFYIKYCQELKAWSEHKWPTPCKLTVAEAEYALWTWYRLAYYGKDSKHRRRHEREFSKNRWVQEQRARQIADSLRDLDRLDLARSFLDTDETVAAIIAWREFEAKVREVTNSRYKEASMPSLIDILLPNKLPPNQTKDGLKRLWTVCGRNPIMHQGDEISDKAEARRVLNGVDEFIEHNTPEFLF